MPKKVTTKDFIDKCNVIHNNRYDYSLVEYVKATKKVKIICPVHGVFELTPQHHLRGIGCKKCGIERHLEDIKNKTKDKFIEKISKMYPSGDYDFSKVEYVKHNVPVTIICKKHGEYQITPNRLTNKVTMCCGCHKCVDEMINKKRQDDFISSAKSIHGEKYDYSKVKYVDRSHTKVEIVCPEHGSFYLTPDEHLYKKRGCVKCKMRIIDTEHFIREANKVHDNFYDYSKTIIKKRCENIIVTCPIHGDYLCNPLNHLNGCRCNKCATSIGADKIRHSNDRIYTELRNKYPNYEFKDLSDDRQKRSKYVTVICPVHGEQRSSVADLLDTDWSCNLCRLDKNREKYKNIFIKKAIEIHGNKYDYSNVEYIDSSTKVKIICPVHGVFYQTPSHHLNRRGCPKCGFSVLERQVAVMLERNNIEYCYEWTNKDVLGKQSVDFYVVNTKICIECQGKQHFYPVAVFGGEKTFKDTLRRDRTKKKKLDSNGYTLLYYTTENVPKNRKEKYIKDINELERIICELLK